MNQFQSISFSNTSHYSQNSLLFEPRHYANDHYSFQQPQDLNLLHQTFLKNHWNCFPNLLVWKKNCLWHFGEIFNSFFTRQLITSEQNISIQWKIKIKWMKMSFRFKSKCRGLIAIPTLRHAVVKFCSHWKFEFICFILKFYVYMEFAIEGLR